MKDIYLFSDWYFYLYESFFIFQGNINIDKKGLRHNGDSKTNIAVDITQLGGMYTNELSNNKGRIVSAFSDIELRYKRFPGDAGVIHGGLDVIQTLKP